MYTVVEDHETMGDWDEGRKGATSAIKTTAYPTKIIKIGGGCTYTVVANCISAIILLNCYKYHAQPNCEQLLLGSNHQKLRTINSGTNEIRSPTTEDLSNDLERERAIIA